MADISKRMEAARQKPGYSRAVFDSFLAEAREAVGDFPEYWEFMGTSRWGRPRLLRRPAGTIPQCLGARLTTCFAISFADAETPAKVGTRYVLERMPAPPVSLQLFRNGVLKALSVDCTITGPFISPLVAWPADDVLTAYYRF